MSTFSNPLISEVGMDKRYDYAAIFNSETRIQIAIEGGISHS